jgi:hypothetical protein
MIFSSHKEEKNMWGNASIALQYLALTPAVVQLVIVLVQLFETEGNGEAKKKAVLDMVKAIYMQLSASLSIKVSLDFILRVAESTIEIAVNFFNLIGLFKHGDNQTTTDTQIQ